VSEPKRGVVTEFKEFVLRGNVVDLAVAVVIGAAFGAVVKALVNDLITPIVSIPSRHTNFEDLAITVRGARFAYGDFLNTVLSFLIVAAAVFFLVKPLNYLMSRRKTEPDVLSSTKECPECLSKIPAAARRCAFCTAELAAS